MTNFLGEIKLNLDENRKKNCRSLMTTLKRHADDATDNNIFPYDDL
jgi:hypothetical protein